MPNKTDSQYWRNILRDLHFSSKMWLEGYDIPPTLLLNPAYQFKKYSLDQSILDSITQFGIQQHFKVDALLQAAFGLLLHRYSSAGDILYGTSHEVGQIDKLIVTEPILPARSIINDQITLLDYLRYANDQFIANKENSHSYNMALDAENANQIKYLFLRPTLSTGQEHINVDMNHYTLALCQSSENEITFFYSLGKFSEKSIHNLFEHFQIILKAIATKSSNKVTGFCILTEHEKQVLLKDWNHPIFKIEQETCVHAWISQQAAKHPTLPAITYEKQTINFLELDETSNQLAEYLLQEGVVPGDKIAVLLDRNPNLIIAMLAIFKIGAIYIPINPKFQQDKIHFILNDSHAKAILVTSNERIPEDLQYKALLYDKALIKELGKKTIPIMVMPNQTAYIIYTSGTTGRPKGVIIKHIGLINLTYWYQHQFNITTKDRASQLASQSFDSFFCETLPFLANGASVHIVDDATKLSPDTLLQWLKDERISICDLPTNFAKILLNREWPTEMDLRILKIGGEPITQLPNKKMTFDIWNAYGTTETTIETTFIKIFAANIVSEKQPYYLSILPIGKPIFNTAVYVVDQYMHLVPIGVAGELLIGGIGLASGYLHREQLNDEKFIPNAFQPEIAPKLYRTGDLVRWMDDGNLAFVDRLDHQVNIKGVRVELSEIETAITQHSDVSEVVVIAKELPNNKTMLVAYLVPNLDKIRIPYQVECLLQSHHTEVFELLSEDISKEGIAVNGLSVKLDPTQPIRLTIKLPESSESECIVGHVVWQKGDRAGIKFDATTTQKIEFERCIKQYLATHHLMDVLNKVSTKRNLRSALKNKMPDYMIPTVVNVMPKFPLTFNGKIDWNALPDPDDFEQKPEKGYIAPKTVTEKALAKIWTKILNLKKISRSDSFFELGGDSLSLSKLLLAIKKHFHITLPMNLLLDLPFLPIMSEYIDSKGEIYSHQSNIQHMIRHDLILPDDISPTKRTSNAVRGILLTGASGFLGIYLLRALLAKSSAKIFCVIRNNDNLSPTKVFMEHIQHYQLESDISLQNNRISLIVGDISQDMLGLSTEQYFHLAENIDVIYHCAAESNTMLAYPELRKSNVLSTVEIIKFATQRMDKHIHFISTFSAVSNTDMMGNYIEDFPVEADASSLVGGLALTKWVAEKLLLDIKNRGLPVSIYRLSDILGQSDTGITNTNHKILFLIKNCIQTGFAPRWNERISMLPVDFVANLITDISQYQPEASKVYHIENTKGMMWVDLIAWLNHYGYEIELIEANQWKKSLWDLTPENALFPLLTNYLSVKDLDPKPKAIMKNTLRILSQLGISYPHIDNQILSKYFDYLCHIGFLPHPTRKAPPPGIKKTGSIS
ncbi:MAG: amino acid adenylation domain-containing protein [Gammaproteobacteria bacterium]|nr:amino acid adenylation domain-containing protein [Gammaproteobacteria bacterium]